eukprot:INCI951.1.p1 GENE.INCI951.1~~INCI951.1.p1  ORF type:complete len:525 (-),score=116.80 INCI951.1:116-1690(-)
MSRPLSLLGMFVSVVFALVLLIPQAVEAVGSSSASASVASSRVLSASSSFSSSSLTAQQKLHQQAARAQGEAAAAVARRKAVAVVAQQAARSGGRGTVVPGSAASAKPPVPGVPDSPLVPLAVKAPSSPVLVRALDDADTDAQAFAAMYPAMNNSVALLKEMDESQVKIKALRLKQAEKQNFLDELQVKEAMLRTDVQKDGVAVRNLEAHVRGLNARLEKLKRQDELERLAQKYNEINSQGQKLRNQVHEINNVKDALYNRMSDIHSDIEALRAKENRDLRLSINVDEDAADERNGVAVTRIVHASGPGGSSTVIAGSGSGVGSDEAPLVVHARHAVGSAIGEGVIPLASSVNAGGPIVVSPFGTATPPHVAQQQQLAALANQQQQILMQQHQLQQALLGAAMLHNLNGGAASPTSSNGPLPPPNTYSAGYQAAQSAAEAYKDGLEAGAKIVNGPGSAAGAGAGAAAASAKPAAGAPPLGGMGAAGGAAGAMGGAPGGAMGGAMGGAGAPMGGGAGGMGGAPPV